jgi:hypothetical protein
MEKTSQQSRYNDTIRSSFEAASNIRQPSFTQLFPSQSWNQDHRYNTQSFPERRHESVLGWNFLSLESTAIMWRMRTEELVQVGL